MLFPSSAWAHSISPELPWWQQWNFSPDILAGLSFMAFVYCAGWRSMERRSTRSKAHPFQARAFAAGFVALVLALVSPIDAMSEELGCVHMLQHTLLMMAAAPLLALSAPGQLSQWVFPAPFWRWLYRLRQHVPPPLKVLGRPLAAWAFYSLTLWIWHLPLLYEKALHLPLVHDLQHLTFFLSSFLFWKFLLDPRTGIPAGPGLIYLFVTSLHAMILGVLMALSPVVWYAPYEESAPLWGLSPLEDQQLAGLIMWMPAGITYVLAAMLLGLRLLKGQHPASRLSARKDHIL